MAGTGPVLHGPQEARVGETLWVLRDADVVLKACSTLIVNAALAQKLTAAAGSAVQVLRTDPEDGTVQCHVPAVGDLWFAAAALTAEAPAPGAAATAGRTAGEEGRAEEREGEAPAGEAAEEEAASPSGYRVPPQATGPPADYEVVAAQARLLREPSQEAEELGRLAFGELVRGTPHLTASGRAWLQITDALEATEGRAAEAWTLLQDAAQQALLRLAAFMCVTVKGDQAQDVSLSVPHSAKISRVKEELRQKATYFQQGKLRLARRICGATFHECADEEPASQDLYLLPRDLAFGPAQLQRELLEVANDPALKCCAVHQVGPLDAHIDVAPPSGGRVKLRVRCPAEYPLQNCTVDADVATSPVEEDGWCGILSKGQLVGKCDPAWKPTLTMRRLLLGVVKMMATWPGFLFSSLTDAVRPFLDRQLRVVYISIGCGGPFLAQKLPRAVQRLHEQRKGRCLLVLIDPLLTYPAQPRNEWRVSHDKSRTTVVCTCNALVEDWDLEGLEEFISVVSAAGVRPDSLLMQDHRGASFMCAPCPINMHLAPVVQPMFSVVRSDEDVLLDDGAKLVVKAVHGISGDGAEDQETMVAMAQGGSCLSFGRSCLSARQLGLLYQVERHGNHVRTELPSELLLML